MARAYLQSLQTYVLMVLSLFLHPLTGHLALLCTCSSQASRSAQRPTHHCLHVSIIAWTLVSPHSAYSLWTLQRITKQPFCDLPFCNSPHRRHHSVDEPPTPYLGHLHAAA